MDMFIRTNRYSDKEKKNELNKSELIFILIGIHTTFCL